MSKDHTPSDFNRSSGYRSDLEVAETGPKVKSINTSFGSKNHNAYVMRRDGTHEHFYYNPQNQKSGWHGHNWETHNNHPNNQTNYKGEKTMDRNAFIESIKADKATIQRCNEVSRNAAERSHDNSDSSKAHDSGGYERGDSGPMSEGREPGYKCDQSNAHNSSGDAHSSGQASSGHGEGAHGTGGHTSGGHGGNGGH